MASAPLKPVYLLSGGDRPKIDRALERLRSRFADGAVESCSALDTSGDEAVALCNALGLFGAGGRLVVVDAVERWKAADVKAVTAYLADPAPATVLVLLAGSLKKDAPLAKAAAKVGDVRSWDIAKRQLPTWVADHFARVGAEADSDACRALVELVGDDLHALTTEVEKLATWAGGMPIGAAEVALLVPPRSETAAYVLTDAWGRRDVPGLLRSTEALLDRSGEPRSRQIPRVVGVLANHVGHVAACQALDAEGIGARQAAQRLGIHAFRAEKAFAHARSFSADELRAAVVRLAALDLALKGKSRLQGDLELERALVDITRGASTAVAPPA